MEKKNDLLIRVFLVYILLNFNIATAFSEDIAFLANNEIDGQKNNFNNSVSHKQASFSCGTTSLTPSEAKNILNLLKDGFVGKELSAKDINLEDVNNRRELENNTIILTDVDSNNLAARLDLPNKKFKPYEMAHFLNTYITGPFAFGIILDDSLRAGRCNEYDKSCWLIGTNLSRRNSGEGLKENTKQIAIALKEALTKDNNKQFSEKDKEVLEALVQMQDLNSEDSVVKTVQRIESKIIPNSILTQSFVAKISTNCNNNGCVISTYSMFDKYFNAWMSAQMVLSSFGPELRYRAGKLFGWLTRRSFVSPELKNMITDIADRFRMKFSNLDSLLGRWKTARAARRMQKYPDFRQFYMSLGDDSQTGAGTGGPIIQTILFAQWWAKQMSTGGFLEKLKTPTQRSEFLKFVKDLRSIVRGLWKPVDLAKKEYAQVLAKYGPAHPATKQAYINFGREYAKFINNLDDMGEMQTLVDAWYWMKTHPTVKLYNKGYLDSATGEVVPFLDEHRPLRVLADKFVATGTLKLGPEDVAKYGAYYGTDDAGNLLLYTIDEQTVTPVRGLSWGNVQNVAQHSTAPLLRDNFIATDHGEFVKLGPGTGDFIRARISGHPQLFTGKWKVFRAETPEEFVARITNPRVYNNIRAAQNNIEYMYQTLRERDFVARRYLSILDRLFAEEDTLVKTYFSLRGGMRLTAYQYGYWYVKRAGIPGFPGTQIEDLSAYMLPESWKEVTIYQKDEPLYKTAYVDFFANEGSDDGDMFARVINNLPWAIVYEKVSTLWDPAHEAMLGLTKSQVRTRVENIAYYFTQPSTCYSCSISIKSENFEKFTPFFVINNSADSYILEDTQSKESKKLGQLLIAYSSHSNIKGETVNDPDFNAGEEIDLLKAIKEKKTCKDAVEQSAWGLQFLPGMKGKNIGPAVAGVIGGAEMLSYYFFFWGGIFSTIWSQTMTIPQFRDCIDVDEGYFIHYFAPAIEEKSKKNEAPQLSTERAADFLQYLKDNFIGKEDLNDSNSITAEIAEDIGSEIDNFIKEAKSKNIVQARLSLSGLSAGQLEGVEMLYFWCGDNCKADASSYRTDGGMNITDKDSNINLTLDFNKGELFRDGVPIVKNPDIVRMASTDTRIPAVEIPHTITTACLADNNNVAFSINTEGRAVVESPELLSCIKDGVEQQTGLDLKSKDLYDVFGKVVAVVTNSHPNITPLDNQIVAEGMPRKIAKGEGSKILIRNSLDVELINSNDNVPNVGKLVSIQFKNGVVVVKPDGCLLIWLKYHEDGILSQNDVKDLKTNLTNVKNPDTNCEEPAVNFEVLGDPNSDYSMEKVRKFNESLSKLGPFQVFETQDKRYILYADENCEEHLRIIDKNTGKIEDYKGKAVQTPTGLKFIDDKGKEHTLDFSVKDGVPMVSYNGQKPETLLAAQGPNGSFWYDPKTGLWYAENGQLLPLLDAFRQGIATQVGTNGNVTSTASGNVLNLQLAEDKNNLFNLPSLPNNMLYLVLFLSSLTLIFMLIRRFRIKISKKIR